MRGLLAEIDSRELTEWMAYEQVEPFGPWRDDIRAGVIASTVANVYRGKTQKPLSPTDFVPEFGRRREEPLVEAMMAQMGMIAAVQNAAAGDADEGGTAAPPG